MSDDQDIDLQAIFSLVPQKREEPQEDFQWSMTRPDSKELVVIFNEHQRQEYIMQAKTHKTKLALHLASEINKHMFREAKELVRFLFLELYALQGQKELFKFMGDLLRQELPEMAEEFSSIRKTGVRSVIEAITWSLDILPPEEHKSFWQKLFGG